MKVFRSVERNADVLEEPGGGELRQPVGLLRGHDGSIRRDVVALHAFSSEEIEYGEEVFSDERLAPGDIESLDLTVEE